MPYVPTKMMISDVPSAEALKAIRDELEAPPPPKPIQALQPTTPEHAAGPGAKIRRRTLVPSVSLRTYRPHAKSLDDFFEEQ